MFDADADKTSGKKPEDATVAKAPQPGKGTLDTHPGGNDSLGKKENKVAPFFAEMQKMAAELAPAFAPLGMKFRPEIILATVLQEASDKDPVNGISFDKGLGLMQITPYQGQLDPDLAKILKWDNSKSVDYNIEHSEWRNGAKNIEAGSHELLDKAKAVRAGVPSIWAEMDDHHKWRATMFAYNAGQGTAIHALKAGGPNGPMISTFKNKQGQTISHDYTKELDSKLSYVDTHDPFKGGGGTETAPPVNTTGGVEAPSEKKSKPEAKPTSKDKDYTPAPSIAQVEAGSATIKIGMKGESVKEIQKKVGASPDGEFGPITQSKVKAFQAAHRLGVDGEVGPHTLAAMGIGHTQGGETGGKGNGTGGVSPAGGGGKGGKDDNKGGDTKGGHVSGDPVAIASKFLGLPSWSPKLRAQLGGPGWHYDNAGREGNNCAEFVSSCLRAAGEIGFQEPGVTNLEGKLVAAGWKRRAGKAESQPGDVWIHNSNPSHTVLVSQAGGGETIGADGSATEYIKQEPMPYPGAKYYHK